MPTETLLQRLTDMLHTGHHSLVVGKDGTAETYDGRGVADLYRLYTTQPGKLTGASIADKVVGKGAAALMAAGGVREVYAGTISRPALQLLQQAGIAASYGTLADHIINRAGTGICPVEALCADAATPQECIPLITQFINQSSCKQHQ